MHSRLGSTCVCRSCTFPCRSIEGSVSRCVPAFVHTLQVLEHVSIPQSILLRHDSVSLSSPALVLCCICAYLSLLFVCKSQDSFTGWQSSLRVCVCVCTCWILCVRKETSSSFVAQQSEPCRLCVRVCMRVRLFAHLHRLKDDSFPINSRTCVCVWLCLCVRVRVQRSEGS